MYYVICTTSTMTTLPPTTLDFAQRMFDAARAGDTALLDAVDAGLPVNLTNTQGTCLSQCV